MALSSSAAYCQLYTTWEKERGGVGAESYLENWESRRKKFGWGLIRGGGADSFQIIFGVNGL